MRAVYGRTVSEGHHSPDLSAAAGPQRRHAAYRRHKTRISRQDHPLLQDLHGRPRTTPTTHRRSAPVTTLTASAVSRHPTVTDRRVRSAGGPPRLSSSLEQLRPVRRPPRYGYSRSVTAGWHPSRGPQTARGPTPRSSGTAVFRVPAQPIPGQPAQGLYWCHGRPHPVPPARGGCNGPPSASRRPRVALEPPRAAADPALDRLGRSGTVLAADVLLA